jgi:hypothetical protein
VVYRPWIGIVDPVVGFHLQFYNRRGLHASGAATSLQQTASQLEKQRGSMTEQVRKVVEEAGGGVTALESE